MQRCRSYITSQAICNAAAVCFCITGYLFICGHNRPGFLKSCPGKLSTTTVLLPFVWNYPGELVWEETFTHSHLSWSSTILYQLSPSIIIYSILPVQFTCLTVFLHNLCPSLLWFTCWSGTLHFILHTSLHPIIVFFSQRMPIATKPVFV